MTLTLTSLLTEAAVTEAPKRPALWAEYVRLLDRRNALRDEDRDTLRRLMAELDLTPRAVELAVQARDQHDAILAKGGPENVKVRTAEWKDACAEYEAYRRGKRGEFVQGTTDRLRLARMTAEGALQCAKEAESLAARFRGDRAVARFWGIV